jgi:hypothetical protein
MVKGRIVFWKYQEVYNHEGRYSYVHCYHIKLFMHLNGDVEMSLPFYLLKSLTKMSKRVHNYPATARRSLFHQGMIKMLVLYALREVKVTWKQLLISLGLDDQDTKQNKPEASTKKGNTSKGFAKMKEISPVARRTRSSKRKLEFQQEEEIKLEPESSASKQKITGFDRYI